MRRQDKLVERIPVAEPGKPFWWRGIDVGEGWLDLVEKLDADIAAIAPDYQLLQCKEKFGGLRFYISLPASTSVQDCADVHSLVRAAEAASYTICEVCGEPGTLREDRTWIRTLCDDHA